MLLVLVDGPLREDLKAKTEKLVIKDDRGLSTLTGTKYVLKTEANIVCELYGKILFSD